MSSRSELAQIIGVTIVLLMFVCRPVFPNCLRISAKLSMSFFVCFIGDEHDTRFVEQVEVCTSKAVEAV